MHCLLEGVRDNFASIVGGFSSVKGGEVTKNGKHIIWEDMGSGQKRSIIQVMLRCKNLRVLLKPRTPKQVTSHIRGVISLIWSLISKEERNLRLCMALKAWKQMERPQLQRLGLQKNESKCLSWTELQRLRRKIDPQ